MQQEEHRKRFVSELTTAIRRSSPDAKIDVDDAEFSIRIGDRPPVNLVNIFGTWRDLNTRERETLIASVIGAPRTMAEAIPESFAEARLQLMPKIRNMATKGMAELVAEQEGRIASRPAERPLGDYHRLMVVFDGNDFMADVSEDILGKWGRSTEEVIKVAIDNFEKRNSRQPFLQVEPGVYMATRRDNYDSSRFLLDGAVMRLGLRGQPLAFPVNRDFLAITGDEDFAGIRRIAEMIDEERNKPYPISTVPLRRESGQALDEDSSIRCSAARGRASHEERGFSSSSLSSGFLSDSG